MVDLVEEFVENLKQVPDTKLPFYQQISTYNMLKEIDNLKEKNPDSVRFDELYEALYRK